MEFVVAAQRNKHTNNQNYLDLIIITTVNWVRYCCIKLLRLRQKYLRHQIYDLSMIFSISPSAIIIVTGISMFSASMCIERGVHICFKRAGPEWIGNGFFFP